MTMSDERGARNKERRNKGVPGESNQPWTYLCTEESESLDEYGVFESAVVASKHGNLPDEEIDDCHSKTCQRESDVTQKGRKRQEHNVYAGCHGSPAMIQRSGWRSGE